MTSSLPACAPDRTSRGDHLLRAFGFVFRKSWYLWGLVLVVCLWKPAEAFEISCVLWVFFLTTSHAAQLVQKARLCLPLGNRRASVFLWWWRVPMTPLVVLVAGGLRGLLCEVPAFRDSAQHTLWAAGLLALLSLVQTLFGGSRPLIQWLRSVVSIGVASLFFLYARSSSPVAVAVASGKYDMAFTLTAAALVFLSFWALRFSSRENLLSDMPMTPQVAARELDRGGGGGARVLSALDGTIPLKRASRHWLAQLLARCLFSYQNLFWLTLILLIHYGFAIPAWKRASMDHVLFVMVALDMLILVDPLILRRLPVSAWTLTSVTAGIALSAVGFLLLPQLAFQRIPGRLEVAVFFSNLFSIQTLGILWAKAALVMGYWTLRTLVRGSLSMSDSWRGNGGWNLPLAAVLVSVADLILAEFYNDFGWRSDVLVGSVLMFGSMALYYGMIRRGDRIYRSAGRTRGARAA